MVQAVLPLSARPAASMFVPAQVRLATRRAGKRGLPRGQRMR